MQLPYFCATAFPQEGLFLDTPLSLKLLSPEACFVFFAEFDSIPHRRDFRFSADEENVRCSSFYSELLLSA